jgi:hypothetical protein
MANPKRLTMFAEMTALKKHLSGLVVQVGASCEPLTAGEVDAAYRACHDSA